MVRWSSHFATWLTSSPRRRGSEVRGPEEGDARVNIPIPVAARYSGAVGSAPWHNTAQGGAEQLQQQGRPRAGGSGGRRQDRNTFHKVYVNRGTMTDGPLVGRRVRSAPAGRVLSGASQSFRASSYMAPHDRVQRFFREALRGDPGFDPTSLLDDTDGQLAIDEVWNFLSRSLVPRDPTNSNWETLGRLCLKIALKYGVLPSDEPTNNAHTSRTSVRGRSTNGGESDGVQRFIDEALLQERESDPIPLLQGVHGQHAIDKVWALLNQAKASSMNEQHRENLIRLCLKLSSYLDQLPAAVYLTDVQYDERNQLGSGSFADVFVGRHGGTIVAVKRLRDFEKMASEERSRHVKSLHREVILWKLLAHQYVLPLLGVWNGRHTLCMVLPVAENGGIREYIRALQAHDTLPTWGPDFRQFIVGMTHQISSGLAYLHDQGIVHGDLHVGNILINAVGNVQIADPGLALIAEKTPHSYASVHGGVAVFTRAPELLDPRANITRPTAACDIFALAFVCYELFAGQRAFPDLPGSQVLDAISNGNRPPRPEMSLPTGAVVSDNIWTLISACWNQEPTRRPTSQAVAKTVGTIIDFGEVKWPALDPKQSRTFDLHHDIHLELALLLDESLILSDVHGTILVYSISTGALLYTLRGHRQLLSSAQGTGRTLVTSSHDGTIRMWDLLTKRCLFVFAYNEAALFQISVVLINPESIGTKDKATRSFNPPLVACQDSSSIIVLNFPPLHDQAEQRATEPPWWRIENNPHMRHCIQFSGRYLDNLTIRDNTAVFWVENAENPGDGELHVWDIVSGVCRWFTKLGRMPAGGITLDTQNDVLGFRTSSGSQSEIQFWSISTGERRHLIEAFNWAFCTDLFPYLSFASSSVVKWDLPSGKVLRLLLSGSGTFSRALVSALGSPGIPGGLQVFKFAHNGDALVIGEEESIKLWDLRSGLFSGELLSGIIAPYQIIFKGTLCVAIVSMRSTKPMERLSSGPKLSAVTWTIGRESENGGS